MNNTNIPIPSQYFHTYNIPTIRMKRMFIMLDQNNNNNRLYYFIRYYKKMMAA